ncbi:MULTISPECIES: hypothetical protein [Sphingobacterium]|uniref:Uncharacterized protein n=1 Tax=Sphingobacterium cellulitidis TaxID=1768011 RepID=A0A8H9KTV1_9SPHI|nr:MULTISPECIES: hypothetical protein [Sphingobacterium]MBA8987120.1 hypothetical protein [Sphingobacterium soli]OYD42015.1 hypothetical protein CHT99_08790 [Sphingobacterium cellulitidis]OYD46783.1 hypothetical protein CHU00_05475 [Sphingobacterium cellulitidis]WFB64694.1 hypothetical protein PZ892_05675 [Sphingobacterium sp. WM]GGE16526.1 hypothetical protein GCM10011516_12810 [Sphingobacterium soli]
MYLIENSAQQKFFNTINELDLKYGEYLIKDGKWLGGGFINLFFVHRTSKSSSVELNLKPEVFMQLPRELRKEIKSLVLKEGN